jgi:hypothetical protein
VRKRSPAPSGSVRAWLGALAVLLLAATLVVLDLTASSVDDYWSRHPFTSSVLSGLLVLLLTVLVADRVTQLRQLRRQARAIAVQAAVLVAQATRTADAIVGVGVGVGVGPSTNESASAADELRTYTVMLLTSAPLLIDATGSRTFLETAQRVGVQLSRVLRTAGDAHDQQRRTSVRLDDEVRLLREAAAPLVSVLKPEEREAINSTEN